MKNKEKKVIFFFSADNFLKQKREMLLKMEDRQIKKKTYLPDWFFGFWRGSIKIISSSKTFFLRQQFSALKCFWVLKTWSLFFELHRKRRWVNDNEGDLALQWFLSNALLFWWNDLTQDSKKGKQDSFSCLSFFSNLKKTAEVWEQNDSLLRFHWRF